MTRKKLKIPNKTDETKGLTFLYETLIGRIFLKVLISPFVSKFIGILMNTRLSSLFISSFVRKNNIDLSEYEEKKYSSYNDFFTRKIKKCSRNIDMKKEVFISPCDAKLTAYKIEENSFFKIKNTCYSVSELLDNEELAKEYVNGYCLIFRLTVDDYHRYCYIDNGFQGRNIHIKGVLYTVRPIAFEKYNVYKENCRDYSILKTQNFGDIVQVEVGATLIGKINNHHENYQFKKGEEKGLFEFGGSTIILLVKNNFLSVDQEILENTQSGYETVVKLGEKIGLSKRKQNK